MFLTVYCPCMYVGSSSSGQFGSSGSAAAIGGAVGGTILFVIISILLIMMLWCVRASHKKKAYLIDNNYLKENISSAVELGSNTNTVKKMKEGEVELGHVQTNESTPHPGTDSQATIKMTTNPSYDSTTNVDIKMTTNPSYGSINMPVCTGDYDYVLDDSIQHLKISNTPIQHLLHCNTNPIKMEANPSYGLTVQDTKTNKAGIKNDYDYIDDGLIQHPASCLPVNTDHQAAAETKEDDYGVVNQPMSDSFSPGTLGRMISEDRSSAGNWPMNDDATKYEDDNDSYMMTTKANQ